MFLNISFSGKRFFIRNFCFEFVRWFKNIFKRRNIRPLFKTRQHVKYNSGLKVRLFGGVYQMLYSTWNNKSLFLFKFAMCIFYCIRKFGSLQAWPFLHKKFFLHKLHKSMPYKGSKIYGKLRTLVVVVEVLLIVFLVGTFCFFSFL